jgi:hypothetical protein
VVVVDNLDEGLDAAALLDHLLTHAAGDLQGVTLNAGDDGIGEGVRLGAGVVGLDNDDLYREPGQHSSAWYFLQLLYSSIFDCRFVGLFTAIVVEIVHVDQTIASSSRWDRKTLVLSYLLTGVTATGDDGHTAHFHDCRNNRSVWDS